MKRDTIIVISIVTYFVTMVSMFFIVEKYIENKDLKLRNDIHNKINEIFSHQDKFVDIAYSGYKVGCKKIPIPKKPKPMGFIKIEGIQTPEGMNPFDKQRMDEWEENYGDLHKMYRVFYKSSDWSSPFNHEDGWNLVIIQHDYEGIYINWFFPYAVGYKRSDISYLPSVKSAVEETFEFFTSNPKSQFYKDFEEGSYNNIWRKIYDAQNEYYYMHQDEHRRISHMGVKPLLEDETDYDYLSSPFQYGYMHNGYYRVFTALTQPQTYTIKKYGWGPDILEKKQLWLYWGIGITILFLLIFIPLSIVNRKYKREKEEELHDKLRRLCHPSNFLTKTNYDKNKLDKANFIYTKLMSIDITDKSALKEIQKFAENELGIDLINKDKVQELKDKVNPKNFIKPYNAEKIALANELYAIITKESLTYDELEEVEEKAKLL